MKTSIASLNYSCSCSSEIIPHTLLPQHLTLAGSHTISKNPSENNLSQNYSNLINERIEHLTRIKLEIMKSSNKAINQILVKTKTFLAKIESLIQKYKCISEKSIYCENLEKHMKKFLFFQSENLFSTYHESPIKITRRKDYEIQLFRNRFSKFITHHDTTLSSLNLITDDRQLITTHINCILKIRNFTGRIKILQVPSDILCLAIHKDKEICVAGCSNGNIMKIDMIKPKYFTSFPAHSDVILAILLSEDRTVLYSGSRDNTIKCWDFEKESEKFKINIASMPYKLLLNRESLIEINHDSIIRSWDITTRQLLFKKKIGIVKLIDTISDSSSYVVLGYEDGFLEVLDRINFNSLSKARAYSEPILYTAVKSNNKMCLSINMYGNTKLWNLPDLVLLRSISNIPINKAIFCHKLDSIYIYDIFGQLSLYDINNLKINKSEAKYFSYSVICISNDHKIIAYGTYDSICLYSLIKHKLTLKKEFNLTFSSLKFSHDDKILVGGDEKGCLHCFSMPFLRLVNKYNVKETAVCVSISLNKQFYALYFYEKNELSIINDEGTSIARCMGVIVSSGTFCLQDSCFVFGNNQSRQVLMLKKFKYIIVVCNDFFSVQMYLSIDGKVIGGLEKKGSYLIIDLIHDKVLKLSESELEERRVVKKKIESIGSLPLKYLSYLG